MSAVIMPYEKNVYNKVRVLTFTAHLQIRKCFTFSFTSISKFCHTESPHCVYEHKLAKQAYIYSLQQRQTITRVSQLGNMKNSQNVYTRLNTYIHTI